MINFFSSEIDCKKKTFAMKVNFFCFVRNFLSEVETDSTEKLSICLARI